MTSLTPTTTDDPEAAGTPGDIDAVSLALPSTCTGRAWETAQQCPACDLPVDDHPPHVVEAGPGGAGCAHDRGTAARAAFDAACTTVLAERDQDALKLLLTILADDTTTSAAAAGVDSLFGRGHGMVSDADIVEAVMSEVRSVVRARLRS